MFKSVEHLFFCVLSQMLSMKRSQAVEKAKANKHCSPKLHKRHCNAALCAFGHYSPPLHSVHSVLDSVLRALQSTAYNNPLHSAMLYSTLCMQHTLFKAVHLHSVMHLELPCSGYH